MCDNAYEDPTYNHALSIPRHRLHWSVPDPVPVGSNQAFEDAFADLEGRVITLAYHLTPETDRDSNREPV